MGGFILMEFIRLGCIDAGQIDTIKARFEILVCMCMHTCMNVCMSETVGLVRVCVCVYRCTYVCLL